MPLDELEIFLGVKRRGALHPGMNGIRRDDVERLGRREHIVTGVVVDHLDA